MPNILDNIAALHDRQRAYHQIFSSPIGQQVLQDLARFCRANVSCWHRDPRTHAALEGRREVYLRIIQHLELTTDQLMELYRGQYVRIPTNEETEIEE